MRKPIDSEESKRIQLEILDGIDRYCRERGLRYSLAYGTMIGAVRHQGFIPWDDDIDLMMPRPDYDRFRKEFEAEGLYVVDLAERDDCVETFVKVCKAGTVMVDKCFQLCPYYKSVPKGRFPLMVKYFLKRLRYFYPGSFRSLKRKLVDGQKAIPYTTSETVGIYYASEKTRTFLPKRIYDEIGTILFEGREYPAPKDYDTYLSSLYGDYMQLPPVEKRVSHHAYDSYIEI